MWISGGWPGRSSLRRSSVDVDVDDVGQGVVRLLPDVAAEHVARDRPVLVPQQVLQHLELALASGRSPRRRGARGAPAGPSPGRRRAGRVSRLGAAAPQQDAQPGQQLGEGERLDEVVVGPGVEAGDAVLDGVAGGQDQDRAWPARPGAGRRAPASRRGRAASSRGRRSRTAGSAARPRALLAVGGGGDLVALRCRPRSRPRRTLRSSSTTRTRGTATSPPPPIVACGGGRANRTAD